MSRLCCFIDNDGLPCQKTAVYRIWPDSPGEETESCAEHLEQILANNPRFTMFTIMLLKGHQ